MAAPQLLVFAGPNGSGKSSITQTIPVTGVYINADKIQEELRCDALTAAQSAARTKLLHSAADELYHGNRSVLPFQL